MKDKDSCTHNQIMRYTHGFFCEDCKTFFDKDSPTYRSGELLSNIWMVLHNLQCRNAERTDCTVMRDKIGIGIKHDNYKELILEAEIIMKKYRKNSNSATFTLK